MFKITGADGGVYGPVGADELRQWISESRANGQSLIQTDGGPEWRALGTFPEFAAALAAVAPKMPAPLPVIAAGSAAATKTNGLAVAGFVLGLLSLPGLCCCCFTPCSILGLIFSCIALSQIQRNPLQGGKAMAIVGIVLSILGLLLAIACLMFGLFDAAIDPSFLR
jgi:hypothetical protein